MEIQKVQTTDNWQDMKTFVCNTCMWYLNTRCRKHAPNLGGFPAVYSTDFCGDHKMKKELMR